MTLRYYVWTHDGPFRLPRTVMNEKSAIPRFAGTTQRIVQAIFEEDGNSLVMNATGHFQKFNRDGFAEISTAEIFDLMDNIRAVKLELESPVPRLEVFQIAALKAEMRIWKLTDEQKDRLLMGFLPADDPRHEAIPVVRPVSAAA